ncbi:MAG: ABC transporter ATP-binding protein [Bacteroidia bacterium]|nr:ABC transporter ATP-binding protein [Bacteroidia bacterium]
MKKLFEKKKVLHDINLQIEKGDCFGLIGKNGSGKSTLLRAVAGIIEQDSGEITVRGKVAPMLALGVGLEPELSGLENIKLLCTLIGYTKDEYEESLKNIIAFSELNEQSINMQVKRYSTGMMSRLAFSIAVANTPEVLIVDEALSVGDRGFREKCAKRIDEIRKQGSTIVYVTHSTDELRRICNKAACLQDGKVVKVGQIDEVISFYENLFPVNKTKVHAN